MEVSMKGTKQDVRFLVENMMDTHPFVELTIREESSDCYNIRIEGAIKYVLCMLHDYKQYINV